MLRLQEGDLSDSWVAAIVIAPFVLLIMTLLGHFGIVSGLLVYVYLVNQSLFERETEYLRSSLDLKGFLVVACGRPLWSLSGIALIWFFRESEWAATAAFLVVGLSPILACVPKMKKVIGRLLGWQGSESFKNALRVVPIGLVISVSISYIFISDALVKLTIERVLDNETFGLYASYNDLIMPACWISMGAIAWDFIPRMLTTDESGRPRLIFGLSLQVITGLVLLLALMLAVPNFRIFGRVWDLRLFSSVAMANLIAASLSYLVFPSLIVMGLKYVAMIGALCGFSLNIIMLMLEAPTNSISAHEATQVAHLVAMSHGVVLIAGGCVLAFTCLKSRTRRRIGLKI
jgi:hypothetical protein